MKNREITPPLEGCHVCCHKHECTYGKQEVWSRALQTTDWTYCLYMSECIVTIKSDRSFWITILTWHYKFQPVSFNIITSNGEYGAQSESLYVCYSHHKEPLNDIKCGLTDNACRQGLLCLSCYFISLISECLIAVKIIWQINMFTIKHVYNKFTNFSECYAIGFDINEKSNYIEMMPVTECRGYWVTHSPSLHTLIDTMHMKPN